MRPSGPGAAASPAWRELEQLAVGIRMRIGERVTNTGLRSEMNHPIKFFSSEYAFKCGPVSDIGGLKAESSFTLNVGEPRLLEIYVIEIIQVIDAHDSIAALEQLRRYVIADKAGGTGNQKFHREHPEKAGRGKREAGSCRKR